MSIHHGCPFGTGDGYTYIEVDEGSTQPLLLCAAPDQQYAVSFTAGAALHSHGVAVAFMGGDLI
jgi:hypothetical protein